MTTRHRATSTDRDQTRSISGEVSSERVGPPHAERKRGSSDGDHLAGGASQPGLLYHLDCVPELLAAFFEVIHLHSFADGRSAEWHELGLESDSNVHHLCSLAFL